MTPAYVVTGCPRSGTTYAAELLTAAGLDCGHEHAYRIPTADFDIPFDMPAEDRLGESSWIAAGWLPTLHSEGAVVVHQVRHPLLAIRSMARNMWLHGWHTAQAQFVAHHTPAVRDETSYTDRLGRFWIDWNRLAAAGADRTWQVETIGDGIWWLAGKIGATFDGIRVARAWRDVPRDVNATPTRPPPVSVADFGPALAGELACAAASYGYDLEEG